MGPINKIIFVAGSGTGRAPMAAEIMKQTLIERGIAGIEVCARGLVVQFPEPMNPKALAVLASNDIQADGYQAKELVNDDITPDSIVLVMKEVQRPRVIEEFDNANEENVFVLSAYVGDEIEVINPYGGSIQAYGLCFEVIKKTTEKLADKLWG